MVFIIFANVIFFVFCAGVAFAYDCYKYGIIFLQVAEILYPNLLGLGYVNSLLDIQIETVPNLDYNAVPVGTVSGKSHITGPFKYAENELIKSGFVFSDFDKGKANVIEKTGNFTSVRYELSL
jgi:hypothetical protein